MSDRSEGTRRRALRHTSGAGSRRRGGLAAGPRALGRLIGGGIISLTLTLALVPVDITAQAPANGSTEAGVVRAIPAAVQPYRGYRNSVERGWRAADGSPTESYWGQWTKYDLQSRLDPETGRLEGTAHIRYANNAPARLGTVWLHLHQNLHDEGVRRNGDQEITGGVELTHVIAAGDTLTEGPLGQGPAYRVDGTLMELRPAEPMEQGDTLDLEIAWSVVLPQDGAGRMGYSEREMYFVAYWFPKMATFDAIRGWDAEPYLSNAEFHDGFGDYTASLSVPAGWSVMATGELQNPEEVYTALTLARIQEAAASDERVRIAGQGERDAGTVTTEGVDGWLTYEFAADSVRDFTWTTSNVQLWDATSAVVADRDGDGDEDRVLIHSFWREDRAPLWEQQWLYGKQAIEFHSRYTGIAYPWSHMTSVEGADIIGGGMEFPMMTLIGPYTGQSQQELFNVTSHEIAHMWVPMMVSTNEKRHAWMDEGMTTFLESESRMEYWPGVDHHRVAAQPYLQVAAADLEQSMMRHGDYYEPGPGYGIASYSKPATLMVGLREVMGHEAWTEAYRTFLSEWSYRHPTPWDFFNTFERAAGRDLDWFWTSFYYETWILDHSVENVRSPTNGGSVVVVQDRGNAIYPARVRVRTTSGETIEYDIPVDHWLSGASVHEHVLPESAGRVTRVELDPSGYAPDVDRRNNIWPRG